MRNHARRFKPCGVLSTIRVDESSRIVATLEEHSILGGLGGTVAEWQSEQPDRGARLMRFGSADAFYHETGEQEDAHEHFGLIPEKICNRLMGGLSDA